MRTVSTYECPELALAKAATRALLIQTPRHIGTARVSHPCKAPEAVVSWDDDAKWLEAGEGM